MRKSLPRKLVLSGLIALATAAIYPLPHARAQFKPRRSNRAATATATTPVAVPEQIVVKVPDSYSDADVSSLAASVNATVLESIPYSPHYYVFTITTATTTDTTGTSSTATTGKSQLLKATSAGTAVGADVKAAVAALIKVAGVKASPNYIWHAFQTSTTGTTTTTTTTTVPAVTGPDLSVETNDPLYYPSSVSTSGQQWDMTMIHMPQAWAVQTNAIGRTVIVAIVDTGMDITHPDMINQLTAGGMDFTPLDAIPVGTPTTVLTDPVGHGTNVGGIVAAQSDNGLGVVGVAGWARNGVDVKLLPVRVLGAGESGGSIATVLAGVNYAVAQKSDVINLSLGGLEFAPADLTTDPFYASLVAAANAGVTVVAAAGNDAVDNAIYYDYPASYPNVIAVTAVGRQRTLASYSNYGGTVAIAAPGGDPGNGLNINPADLILNTWGRSTEALTDLSDSGYPLSDVIGYETVAGTSQATPHVSGAVALLIAAGAPEDPVQIKSILQNSAQMLDETPSLTGGNKYGAGLLDVYHALTSLSTLNPGFTAQIADVVDNAIDTNSAATTFPASGSTGYSLISSEPYTDRGLSYVRPQEGFVLRYVGRPSLIDATGVDHPEYVTIDISPATIPTSILRHFVGSTANSATTFALPSLPTGSNPASVQSVAVPSTAALNLPDGNYRATLKVFNAATGVQAYQEQGIVFFEVASHTQPQGLSMFTSPFLVNPAIVGSLPPELFEFGTSTNFTLARYNAQRLPTDLEYATYSPTPNATQNSQAQLAAPRALDGSPISYLVSDSSTSVAPVGLGYWVSLDADVTLNPTGSVINSAIAVKLFASNGGWNMIGDPFTYSVSWPSATVISTTGQSYSLQAAATAGIISPAIVGYSGGQYVYSVAPAGTLDPFQGYWVRAFQDCTIILAPTSASTRAAHPIAASTRAAHTSQLAAIDGWRVRLSATASGDHDGENYFGLLRSTSLTERFYDIAKPPSGAGHAYLRFAKPDTSGKAEIYAMDMRKEADSAAAQTWSAEVSTDKANIPVTLTWDGLGNVPHGSTLSLTDLSTGKKVSMHSRSSYTFNSGVAGSTKKFEIALEKELSAGPLTIRNFQVVTVPGGKAVGRSTSFRFNASEGADVTAVVRALDGRVIATVNGSGTRAEAAADTVLHWNGRKSDGSAVPVGMYFVEVTLTTTDGKRATVKQPFMSLN